MTDSATRPSQLDGIDAIRHSWQNNEIPWSFQRIPAGVLGLPDASEQPAISPATANESQSSTTGPQCIAPQPPAAVWPNAWTFGKRSLQSLFEWEGVVESVAKSGFQCRITPISNGRADPTLVEMTEFSFEDLAAEDDQSRVVPGAVLYWTVGRARNAAGTITNLSLVRLRRLPNVSPGHAARADVEAARLLSLLPDFNGPEPTGA